MKLIKKIGSRQFILLGVFFVLFSLSYTTNIFHVSESDVFHGFERQPEGLVIGRLARSAQDGIFSYGGFNGINYDSKTERTPEQYAVDLAAQHDLYLTNKQLPDSYYPYKSQSGGQAFVFTLIQKMSPFSNANNLMLFRGLNALLIAFIFCLFAGWIYRNYGFIASLVTLILIFFSPWVNMFSHNLWWVLWNFYLPFVTMLLMLEKRQNEPRKVSELKVLGMLFIAVFLKCFFSGFEFITTTLVSAICPIFYYWIKERRTLIQFVAFSIKASLTMLLALVSQMLVLVTQIKFVDGTFMDGFHHIINSFTKRSEFGDDDIQMSLFQIIQTYLKNDAFQLGFLSNQNQFHFGILAIVILIAGIIVFISNKSQMPILATTLFSLLAPLSWLIVFKQHAVNHTHMDYIIWYMPFLLYGFCVIGIAVSSLFKEGKSKQVD